MFKVVSTVDVGTNSKIKLAERVVVARGAAPIRLIVLSLKPKENLVVLGGTKIKRRRGK